MNAIRRGLDHCAQIAAQLCVMQAGQIVADVALGEARPGLPLRTDTLMPWLSAGKPIAAVAIAQLWERGLLDLDDKVATHLPAFAADGKENITIRHILTHTAGFRAVIGANYENQPWDKIIVDLCATKLEPGWTIGQTAGYHPTTSWYILGELVRLLDGRSFDIYAREMVFEPIGMRDSHFALSPEQYATYGDRIGLLNAPAANHPPSATWMDDAHGASQVRPGASARGPIRELGLFYETLRRGGVSSSGNRILSPQAVEAITSPHRVGVMDKTFKHIVDWTLGFIAQSKQYGAETVPYNFGNQTSGRTYGHGGSRCAIGFCDPDHALVVALVLSRAANEMEHHQRMREIYAALDADLGFVKND